MASADLDRVLAREMAILDTELQRAQALVAVSSNGYELKNVSENLRADRTVVLATVRQCGVALRFASNELVADKVIVLAAVLQNPEALRFAAAQFEGAKQVVIAAVRQDPEVMELAAAAFQQDPEILIQALCSLTPEMIVRRGDALLEEGPAGALNFLRRFDWDLLVRLHFAMVEWIERLIASGDEEAAHRLPKEAPPYCNTFSIADYAGWANSKFDRCRALMVLYRSDPFRRYRSLAPHVLKFL